MEQKIALQNTWFVELVWRDIYETHHMAMVGVVETDHILISCKKHIFVFHPKCVEIKLCTKTVKPNNSCAKMWSTRNLKCKILPFLKLKCVGLCTYVVLAYKTGKDRTKVAKAPAKIDLLGHSIKYGKHKKKKNTNKRSFFTSRLMPLNHWKG